jgi:hypothetical protein
MPMTDEQRVPAREKPKICGAKTRSGEPCKQTILGPSGRCKFHGGASLRGPDLPQFKHGRYSKLFPKEVRKRFEEAQDDPERLSLEEDVSLIQAHIADVAANLDVRDSAEFRARLREAWGRYQAIISAKEIDSEKAIAARANLGTIIANGADDAERWSELIDLIERKANVSAKEWKRQTDMQSVISLGQAMVLMQALLDSVIRNVGDRAILGRIMKDVQTILGPAATRATENGNNGESEH